MISTLANWQITSPIDFDIGETYIVDMEHVSGSWAKVLITIIEHDQESETYKFEVETILDGSPGILEGYLGANYHG